MHVAVGMNDRTQPEVCEVIQFLADHGAALDELNGAGRTPMAIADNLPVDLAVDLLTKLITGARRQAEDSVEALRPMRATSRLGYWLIGRPSGFPQAPVSESAAAGLLARRRTRSRSLTCRTAR